MLPICGENRFGYCRSLASLGSLRSRVSVSQYLLIGSIPIASEMQGDNGCRVKCSKRHRGWTSSASSVRLPAILSEAYVKPLRLHPFQPFAVFDR
jgi:hypothetical protein